MRKSRLSAAAGSLILGLCCRPFSLAAADEADASTVSGLVAYWSFDEGKGSLAVNLVGKGGDLFGGTGEARAPRPKWAPGRFGAGVRCPMDVGAFSPLMCEREVTIAAWVKLAPPKGRWIFLNHEHAYRLGVNQAGKRRVQFQLNLDGRWASNWLASRASLEANRWYHLAGVYDGRERRIYIDGRLDATAPARGRIGNGHGYRIGGGPEDGILDELRVWNRALSDEEIRALFGHGGNQDRKALEPLRRPEHRLLFYPVRVVGWRGKAQDYVIHVFNSSGAPFRGRLSVDLTSSSGERVYERTQALSLRARAGREVELRFKAEEAGTYVLRCGPPQAPLYSTDLYVMAPCERPPAGELKLNRVASTDLTAPLGPDRFLDDGTSRVVDAAFGRYREAGEARYSRFVARMRLDRTGLHLVRVTYPDDKPRTCEIICWSPDARDMFSAQTGYFTGNQFPLSGAFKTVELVIWARDPNQAVVFTTRTPGQPAAASRIDAFEIQGRLPASPASLGPTFRKVGLYWEDAQPLHKCFGGTETSLAGFDRMVGNLCDYLDYSGQNVLYHPAVWYDGPIYSSLVESRLGNRGGGDFPTAGWLDIVLKRFEERGFTFFATLNVHQLPSLVMTMNADIDRIRGGAPTFNVVTGGGEVKGRSWHHRPPAFNALHPKVQGRVLALVGELAERYGSSPAFGGVSFHLTMCQLLWPSDLRSSYDDWTIAQFEKDTGLRVPAKDRAPRRFSERHRWLTEHARERWIGWRCARFADFCDRASRRLRRARPDLQLVLSVWDPFHFAVADRWRRGERVVDVAREFGVDPVRLGGIPGVMIQRYLSHTDFRHRLSRHGAQSRESLLPIRRLDFAEDEIQAFQTTEPFGVYFHNRYFEASSRRMERLGSAWYRQIHWRASAIVPSHEHFMEYYAYTMAAFDPGELTTGGFTTGTVGHEGRVERFARVFRALPVGDWEELQGLGERVRGRMLVRDGKRYLYVVNRSPQGADVVIPAASGITHKPEPLGGSPELKRTERGLAARLGPYQLAAWISGE